MKCDHIRTRLQGGTPFFPNMLNNGKVEVCLKEDVDEAIYELKYSRDEWARQCTRLTSENAELKAENERLDADNKKLTNNVIREINAHTEIERITRRALWLAREWRAWCEGQLWFGLESDRPRDVYHLSCTNRIHRTPNEWIDYWHKVEQKCKAKAEEYK